MYVCMNGWLEIYLLYVLSSRCRVLLPVDLQREGAVLAGILSPLVHNTITLIGDAGYLLFDDVLLRTRRGGAGGTGGARGKGRGGEGSYCYHSTGLFQQSISSNNCTSTVLNI